MTAKWAAALPVCSEVLLGQVRDALGRLGGDVPLYSIELTSMMLALGGMGGQQTNPLPVLILAARGVAVLEAADEGIMTWAAMPGWKLSQEQVDQVVTTRLRNIRATKAAQLADANGGRRNP